jgi:hypothetical protein
MRASPKRETPLADTSGAIFATAFRKLGNFQGTIFHNHLKENKWLKKPIV